MPTVAPSVAAAMFSVSKKIERWGGDEIGDWIAIINAIKSPIGNEINKRKEQAVY